MKTRRIVLIGFSGAGKSTVGRELAHALGWNAVDLDAEIERRDGRAIPDIFREVGEPAFRSIEQVVFADAMKTDGAVIATGGGAVVNDAVWSDEWLGAADTLTVLLEAPARSLFDRLQAQQALEPTGTVRPMLEGDDPLARITALKEQRDPWYRRARMVVPGDGRSIEEVVTTIAGAIEPRSAAVIALDVPGGSSSICIDEGALDRLGEVITARWPKAQRVWVIADEVVAAHHLHRATQAVQEGVEVRSLTFPSGESSKSMAGLGALYDGLLSRGVERSDVIVALGGGVAGDLVGFAAATVLRGIGLVQVPTSLLAMVDSSVGGKTGINHASGKNLIGAFYQPPVVLIDPSMLGTLPEREYRSGWAEIIKHGLIEPSTPARDSGLFDLITHNVDALVRRESPLLTGIIARNVEIKASVVRSDEREAGLRAILNFGHTIGHAVEAAGYQLLHGEAVAVGLHGAMRLGVALGRIPGARADAVADVLDRFGLPTAVSADVDRVRQLMLSDKKRVAGEQHWILPSDAGGVSIEQSIPDAVVTAALNAVIRR